jgi:flavodoxin
MKNLIVYYSLTKNNELLAKLLQARLGCEMLRIETVRKKGIFSIALDVIFGRKPAIRSYNISIVDYDHLIIVGPVWMGKIAAPLRTFLSEEKGSIIRYSFISVCGGLTGQKEKIESELEAIVGMRSQSVLELWVSEIMSSNVTRDSKNVSAYRITSTDLEKFKIKIDEFCDALRGEMVK